MTPRAAIWATIGLLLAASLASVALWARNIGMAEDWLMVPAMTGTQPDLMSWLWSQNNEHRLPVQRLIYLVLLKLSGDFRSGMVVSQLLLASLALALAWAAAAARGGKSRWTDVLFPLALLHLGHWENLVWGWQLQFVWSVVLYGFLLAILSACPGPMTPRAAWAASALLLLMPVAGANGILFAAALAPWFVAQGLVLIKNADGANHFRLGLVMIGATILSLGLIGVYFIGYERPDWTPPPPTPDEFVRTAEMYFAYALGPMARWMPTKAAVLVAICMIGGGLLSLRIALTSQNGDRLRAFGLFLFIAAGVGLGLAIAWGRGGYPYRIPDRYALFSVLPLIASAYAWELYVPRRLGRIVTSGLAILFLVLLPFNMYAGSKWRDWYVDGMLEVEADIDAGVPIPELARRHYPFLLHWSEDKLRDALTALRQSGIGPFSTVPAE
jgi:hypothetical protein